MKLLDFMQKFPDEVTCVAYLKEMRINYGVTCKRCAGKSHYWKTDKGVFQCKNCGFRTSLKSGTAIVDSNLPLHTWLKAIYLISATKKTFSAVEIQKQLGFKSYEPIWKMLHNIRCAMGVRDSKYELSSRTKLFKYEIFVNCFIINQKTRYSQLPTNVSLLM